MIFYRSFFEALRELDSDTKALLYDSIFEYGLNFKEPVLTGVAKTVFTLIRPQLDANIRKFENGKKGAEHGAKGGRPTADEPENNRKETPKEPLKNPTVTPNVNAKGNENPNPNQNSKDTKVSPEKGNASALTNERVKAACEYIIGYLNTKTGKAFKPDSKDTVRMIRARLSEGYEWPNFRTVIDGRCSIWGADPKMAEYLRPVTLFGTKFESYLNADATTQSTGSTVIKMNTEAYTR